MSIRTKRARFIGTLAAAASLLCAACATSGRPDQMRIGLWAFRHELWDEAVFRWQRILESDPGSASAHNNLAVAYEVKGRWEDARLEYEAALKIDPQNARIRSNYDQFKKNMAPPGERPPEAKKKDDAKKP